MELGKFETEEDELELVDAVVVVRTCGIRGLPLEEHDVKCLEQVATYHLQRLDSMHSFVSFQLVFLSFELSKLHCIAGEGATHCSVVAAP